jgi:hypothetical protein
MREKATRLQRSKEITTESKEKMKGDVERGRGANQFLKF